MVALMPTIPAFIKGKMVHGSSSTNSLTQQWIKNRARSQLISKMKGGKRKKGELDKANVLQCDHYVLMTNTLLTAGNKRKIEDAKNEKGYTFSLICWGAADLIAMTDAFPYLLNSFPGSAPTCVPPLARHVPKSNYRQK